MPDDKEWLRQVRFYADRLIVAIDSNQRLPAVLRRSACGLIEQALKLLKEKS